MLAPSPRRRTRARTSVRGSHISTLSNTGTDYLNILKSNPRRLDHTGTARPTPSKRLANATYRVVTWELEA